MEKNVHKIFVYGSLRSGFQSPAYNYISKYFTFIGNAKTKGLLFDIGDYPVATPTNQDSFIVGELFEIKNKDAFDFAIAQLDDYEGLNAEDGEFTFYQRSIEDIFINGVIEKAWVYWFTGDIQDKPIVESGDVLEYAKNKLNK